MSIFAKCRYVRVATGALLACVVLCACGSATAQPARPRPTDDQVDAAVRRGLGFLYARQQPGGNWDTRYARRHPGGVEALIVLAALSAGESPDQPKLKSALAYIKGVSPPTVYARAMRTMVYARLAGVDYAKRLGGDVAWLIKHQRRSGGWGYGPAHPTTTQRPDWTDSSNSQMAVLALHEAAAAGARVPINVWKKCRRYFARAQNADGGWGYEPPGAATRLRGASYGTMTAASVATFFILHDRLGDMGDAKIIGRGLGWLDKHHKPGTNPGWIWGAPEERVCFYAWCLARAAESSGRKTVGPHDWCASSAARLIAAQNRDGSWGDPGDAAHAKDAPVRTCFAILALLHARKPVVVHRLDLAGEPGANFRDAANATAWLNRQLRTNFTWHLLPVDAPAKDFRRAPILYIDATANVEIDKLFKKISPKLRYFLRNGGTVLVQAPPGGGAQAEAMKNRFLQIFPAWRAWPLGEDEPVLRVTYCIPPVRGIGVGDRCRTRVFIVTSDLASAWRRGRTARDTDALQFFANLLLYATDGKLPTGRLTIPPSPKRLATRRSIRIARVRHKGDWSACPLMADRLSNVLARAISVGVREAHAVDLTADVPDGIPLLWMTGSVDPNLTGPQRERLAKYLRSGGTLMIDSTVGRKEFFEAVSKMLVEMFGADGLKRLPPDHPLLTGRFAGGIGSDVTRVRYTRAVPKGKTQPVLLGVEIGGRIAVVLSRYGVTCSVEGNPTFGQESLATDDARRLAANVVLYAVAGRKKGVGGRE